MKQCILILYCFGGYLFCLVGGWVGGVVFFLGGGSNRAELITFKKLYSSSN